MFALHPQTAIHTHIYIYIHIFSYNYYIFACSIWYRIYTARCIYIILNIWLIWLCAVNNHLDHLVYDINIYIYIHIEYLSYKYNQIIPKAQATPTTTPCFWSQWRSMASWARSKAACHLAFTINRQQTWIKRWFNHERWELSIKQGDWINKNGDLTDLTNNKWRLSQLEWLFV